MLCGSHRAKFRLELGMTLPDDPGVSANNIPFRITGDTLYLSCHVSRASDGSWIVE